MIWKLELTGIEKQVEEDISGECSAEKVFYLLAKKLIEPALDDYDDDVYGIPIAGTLTCPSLGVYHDVFGKYDVAVEIHRESYINGITVSPEIEIGREEQYAMEIAGSHPSQMQIEEVIGE